METITISEARDVLDGVDQAFGVFITSSGCLEHTVESDLDTVTVADLVEMMDQLDDDTEVFVNSNGIAPIGYTFHAIHDLDGAAHLVAKDEYHLMVVGD